MERVEEAEEQSGVGAGVQQEEGAKCVEDQPLAGAARITEGGGQGAEAGDHRLRLAREADLDLADPLLLLGEEELGQEGAGGVALCEAGAGLLGGT